MKMNKFTKGSIAAGAGLVLLLGGAGTFMSWNDEGNIDGGTVTAGSITVEDAISTWTVNDVGVDNIDVYRIAPGDTVVYTSNMNVVVDGDNLVVTPALSEYSIAAASDDAADQALADQLTQNVDLKVVGAQEAGNGTYALADGTHTVTVTATLGFDYADASSASEQGAVSLSGLGVGFTQNLNPAVTE